MITRAKLSSVVQGLPKYRSMLAGNSAYLPSSFDSIATVTGSSQSTITFSSIPTTYKHLQLRLVTRMSAGTVTDLAMTFNGVTSTSYYQVHLRGNGSAVNAFSSNDAYITASQTTGASATANCFGVAIIDIYNYAMSDKRKTARLVYGNNTSGAGQIRIASAILDSAPAITSITFTDTSAGNFLAGSRIALYGIKG